MIADLRRAGRLLTANKAWTTVALLSLGFGIGLNALVFSIVESVLLRPFPYEDPDRLVLVWGSRDPRGGLGLSQYELDYVRAESTLLDGLGAWGSGGVAVNPGIKAAWLNDVISDADIEQVFTFRRTEGALSKFLNDLKFVFRMEFLADLLVKMRPARHHLPYSFMAEF